MIGAVAVLLVGCGEPPPAELGACAYQSPTTYGVVVGIGASDEPAIECDGWWACDDGVSFYNGRVYGTSNHAVETAPGSARIPSDAVEAAQDLACDRCRWRNKPPIAEDPNALDLWGACDWWMP